MTRLVGYAGGATQLLVSLLDRLARDALHVQHAAGVTLILGQGNKQVLSGSVGVAHFLGGFHGVVQDLHEVVGGHSHGKNRVGDLRFLLDFLLDVHLHGGGIGADALKDDVDVAVLCVKQGLQQVKRLDGA